MFKIWFPLILSLVVFVFAFSDSFALNWKDSATLVAMGITLLVLSFFQALEWRKMRDDCNNILCKLNPDIEYEILSVVYNYSKPILTLQYYDGTGLHTKEFRGEYPPKGFKLESSVTLGKFYIVRKEAYDK